MKRTRSFQNFAAMATRTSSRNKENLTEMKETPSSSAVQTEFVLPVDSEVMSLDRPVTRSQQTTSQDSEAETVEAHGGDPVKEVRVKNLRRKRLPNSELKKLLAGQSELPPSSNSMMGSNLRSVRIGTRSSQRIASQVDKSGQADPKNQPTKTALKLPKAGEIKHSFNFPLVKSDNNSSQRTSSNTRSSSFSSSLKDIPTFDLLKSPRVLAQSVMYLNSLKAKFSTESNSDARARDRILMPPPTPRSKKVSCSGPDEKLAKMKAFVDSVKPKTVEEDAELNVDDVDENARHPLVTELMSRCIQNNSDSDSDGDDDSVEKQKKSCLSKFFPDYHKNNAQYKNHSRIIGLLTFPDLNEHFHAIRNDLKDIFDGKLDSTRSDLFLRGRAGDRQKLKDINVSIPFTNQQGMVLITNLYDFLIPAVENRLKYSDYLSFVMLPETYIRIYSRVTGLSYQKAELEMKYGACYDEAKQ